MPSPGPSHLSRVSIHPDSQAHLQLIGLPGLPLGQEESLASRQHRKSEVLRFPAGTQTTKRRLPGFLVIQKDALDPSLPRGQGEETPAYDHPKRSP